LQYWGRSNTHQHWFAIGLQLGQKFFNVAFCSYLHLQYFNWAAVPGGRISNPPTSQSPIVVRHTMRKFIQLVLFLISFTQTTLGQTKYEIRKFKISKIEQTIFLKKHKRIYTKFFDKGGELIKEIEVFTNPYFKTETNYKYLDTLCIETIDIYLDEENKVSKRTTNFEYLFDNEKRMTQKITRNSEKNISIEKYSYNQINQIDTIFFYNNDTTINVKGNFLNYETKTKKEATLKKIKSYTYLDKNNISIKECNFPLSNNDKNCKLIEDFESNTLKVHKESYYAVENHSANWKKWHKKDGLVYLFESSDFENKTFYFYQKNKFGFILEKKSSEDFNNINAKISSTWKYYYRQ
jgi:hypothetical protein